MECHTRHQVDNLHIESLVVRIQCQGLIITQSLVIPLTLKAPDKANNTSVPTLNRYIWPQGNI